MNNLKKFVSFAESKLGREILKQSGNILYSSASTLQPGPVYLIGTNPGGDPNGGKTIQETLNVLPERTENGYINEEWGNKEAGESKLQRRVRYLLEDICGLNTEDVCASNLIFIRSKNTKSISNRKFKEYADICWPVHERILQIVSPSLIMGIIYLNDQTL